MQNLVKNFAVIKSVSIKSFHCVNNIKSTQCALTCIEHVQSLYVPDAGPEMTPYAAFHLGLHCLPKYMYEGVNGVY